MPSAEHITTPREIRNFAILQIFVNGAFLVALFWVCGRTDADYPPTWLAIALVLPLILAAFLSERIWLKAKPLSPHEHGSRVGAEAVNTYAWQTVRKIAYVEAAMLPAVIVGFAGSYAGWPILIAGFPGIVLLAWEIWPSLRNVSRSAVVLDSGGANSGLVDGFVVL